MYIRIFATTIVSMVILETAFAEQRYDFSGDITTGINVDYQGTDDLYVTYYGGTLTNGGAVPFDVRSSSNTYTSVNIGYMPDGNLGVPAGTINSSDVGVFIESSSQLAVRNAASITSAREGIYFSVYDNNTTNTLYNQGSVTSNQTGVYLNQYSGDAIVNFQNDGHVSASGAGAITAVMIDNGGDPAMGSFSIANNGTIQGMSNASAISNVDNATKSIEVSNLSGGVISAINAAVYISGGSRSTMIDNVSISNTGTIQSSTYSSDISYADSVSIINSGMMTGTVRMEGIGVCDFKNSGTIYVSDGSGALIFNVDSGTFEHMSGSTINGEVYIYGNSTFVVHNGSNKITGGNVSLNSGTMLKLVFDTNELGSLVAAGSVNLFGTTLLLDLTNASDINVLDQYVLVASDTAINGAFLGLSQGSTFWEGNYEFQITYGTNDISLTVLNVIPEPSSYALFMGLTGVGLLTLRRRKSFCSGVSSDAFLSKGARRI